MDTERYFKATEENLKNIQVYVEGTQDTLKEIIEYVEITRHLQEIHQWFDIFMYSLKQLKSAVWNKEAVEINTYLISLISTGKIMVDSIKLCITNNLCEEESLFINEEYDGCFSYRFLVRLRNYSQHGHIPVSLINDRPQFDFMQIYQTPHYKFNKQLEREVSSIIEFIQNKQDISEGPMLDFEMTVCAYTCSIFKIYKKFLEKIRACVEKYRNKIQEIVREQPEIIKHNRKELDGWLFYVVTDIDSRNLQAVDAVSDSNEEISKWKNDIVDILKTETKILKEMFRKSELIGAIGDGE